METLAGVKFIDKFSQINFLKMEEGSLMYVTRMGKQHPVAKRAMDGTVTRITHRPSAPQKKRRLTEVERLKQAQGKRASLLNGT